jgi:hypothetical protein
MHRRAAWDRRAAQAVHKATSVFGFEFADQVFGRVFELESQIQSSMPRQNSSPLMILDSPLRIRSIAAWAR